MKRMARCESYIISAQGLEAAFSEKSRSEAVSTEVSCSPSLKWPLSPDSISSIIHAAARETSQRI